MSSLFKLLFLIFILSPAISAHEDISIELTSKHQFQFAGYYMAKEKGYYEECGLDVEIIEGYKKDVLNDVQNRSVDFGVTGSGIVRERVLGKPFVALSAIFQNSPMHWIVRKDSNITKMNDLIGKKVMLPKNRMQTAELLAMFKYEGIDEDQINIIDSSYDINSLVNGETDAFNGYISNEPFTLQRMNIQYRVLHPEKMGIDFYGDVLFTSEAMLKDNPEVVKAFKEASLRGWEYAFENIDETVELILKKYNTQNKTKAQLIFEAEELKKFTHSKILKLGHMSEERWTHIAQTYKDLGFIEKGTEINLNGFVYNTEYSLDKMQVRYAALALMVLLISILIHHIYKYKKGKMLKKLKDEYQQFFDLAPLPYQSVDSDGYILKINQTWIDELGYERDEVIGRNFSDFLIPEQISLFRKRFQNFKKEGMANGVEFTMLTKDGKKIIASYNGRVIYDETGNPLFSHCIFENITAKIDLEKNLRELNEKNKKFIENFNGILFSGDMDFRVKLFAGKVEDITGYKTEEFLNNELRWNDIVYPEDIKILDKDSAIRYKYGYSSNRSYRITKKDGSIANVQEYIYNISDSKGIPIEVEGIIYDITAQTELQKNIQSMFDVIPSMLITSNGKHINNANPAMLDFFGYKSLDEFTAEHDCVCDYFIENEGCLQPEVNGIRWLDYIISHPDELHKACMQPYSKKHTFIVLARPFNVNIGDDDSDTGTHFIVMFNDITELENKEEIMLSQSRHAAMGEMIGMIAHQWRQPITTIAMEANNIIVDSALGNTTEESINEFASGILEQTQHLSKTIDDFRDFFKPNKELENIKVCSVLDETLSIIGSSLTNNNIKIKKELNCESHVSTYSRELLQVFINILKNAKEVLLEREIKNAEIVINVTEDDKSVITQICDNAGGIRPNVMPKIFDPYFTTKDERTGTGLGLYMSKTIVNKHLKGILSVENRGEGACFVIVLPKLIDGTNDEQ